MSSSDFLKLQPLCMNVAKCADVENLRKLRAFLEERHEPLKELEFIKEYVSFPLLLILKQLHSTNFKRNDLVLREIFKCFCLIFQDTSDIDWKLFCDVFLRIFICLSDKENPQTVAQLSEECKQGGLNVICHLCQTLTPEGIYPYCDDVFKPQLGHAIFICLQIADKEKSKILKVKALRTIQSLGLHHISSSLDASSSQHLRKTFAGFLPGICQSAFRIAKGDEIQGHLVSVAALQCLEYFVPLVMSDSFLSVCVPSLGLSESAFILQQKLFPIETIQENVPKSLFDKNLPASLDEQEMENNTKKLKAISIDRKWVSSTSERLVTLIDSLNSLLTHSHWEVRMSLANCCQAILHNCQKSLFGCLVSIMEMLITLRADPILDVSSKAETSISFIKSHMCQDEKAQLLELLQERVYSLTTRLPTVAKSQNDSHILSLVERIFGCLDMMGEGLPLFVQMPNHLERLLRSFLVLLSLDCSDVDLLSERFQLEDELDALATKPDLGQNFIFFRSKAIVASISKTCALLTSSKTLFRVVDFALDLFAESTRHQKESLLLLHFFIKGATASQQHLAIDEKEKIVSTIIDTIILKNVLETPIKFHSEDPEPVKRQSPVSVEAAKSNVVLLSTSLHLIGSCALFLGKDFKPFLSTILCPILEKAGSSNAVISRAASIAVKNAAESSGYSDVPEFIEMAVPYFWFGLSQKLKKLPEHPEAAQVLRFALKGNKGKVKVYMEDLVEDIIDSLDKFHEDLSFSLLTILAAYIESEQLAESLTEEPSPSSNCGSTANNLRVSICDYLQEIDTQHNIIQNELNEDFNHEELSAESFKIEKDQTGEDPEGNPEESTPPPRHIELITKILERCSYLLFVKDRKTHLAILQIIEISIPLLEHYENQRLPVFHKLWKPLVLRLKDKDFVVILKALQISTLMMESSSDFLAKRFLTDLFPSLLTILKSQSAHSLNKVEKSGYFQTPTYKIQSHILQTLPSLIKSLDLGLLESIEVIDALLLYLDERQPKLLLQGACCSLEALSALHPDLVWEFLAHCKGSLRILPPSTCLSPVIIKGYKDLSVSSQINPIYEKLS